MEIKIDELIVEAIKKIDVNAIFQEQLKKQIESTIQHCLKESLGNYSDFSKSFKKAMEEKIGFNPDRLSLPQYSEFVVKQCEEVINDLMSEERGKVIQKSLRDKLAPHLVDEIEFDKVIDAIESSLMETIKEEADQNSRVEYTVECTIESGSFSSGWHLAIYEGKKERNNEMAVLFFTEEGKCYHSRGKSRDEFAKRFSSYVFNKTLIHHAEEYSTTLTWDDLI